MTNNKTKIINWILNILLIVFAVIVTYVILARVFGNSPTDFTVILWIAGFLGTAIIKLFSLIYGLNREVGELKVKSFHAFDKIKRDTREIKLEIGEIKDLVAKRRKKQ